MRKPLDEPTLPLANEQGRFLPGTSAVPAKRVAARMWHLAAQRSSQAVQALHVTLEDGARRGITWAEPSASNGNGATPLHIACIQGNKPGVNLLLAFRGHNEAAFVNRRDAFGNTALMAAACRGRVGCVALLLNANANPNIKNKQGYTGALQTATHPSQPHPSQPTRPCHLPHGAP